MNANPLVVSGPSAAMRALLAAERLEETPGPGPRERGQPAEEKPEAATREQLDEAVGEMNKLAELFRTEISFEVDEESHRIVVKIIDGRTGETIREIPPESALKRAKAMQELAGLIFDEQA